MPSEAIDNAYFEHISIPEGQCFLWRMDDYPWRRNVWNFHPEIEIHLIRRSSGLCYIGDYIGHFEPGHLVMVGSNLPHNWITLPASDTKIRQREIVLQFDPISFLKAGQSVPELNELSNLFDRAALGVEFYGKDAEEAAAILERIGEATGLKRLALLTELLATMLASKTTRSLATQHFVSSARTKQKKDLMRLELALNYLQENFLENPRITEVASIVHMSEASFSRFFKAQTGNTFTEHITTLKIWAAKKLLRDSELSVTDICFESGFRNVSNFNRMFLRYAGMKPSEYRRAFRGLSTLEINN